MLNRCSISCLAGATDRLSFPMGLIYDEVTQNLYISNSGISSGTVMRWRIGDSNGTIIAGVLGSSGSNSSQLKNPAGITSDQWRNLYVMDRGNDRVQLFCNGNLTGVTIAGRGLGGTNFSNSFDVKLDSQLNLYVVDYSENRVTKFAKLW